MVGVFALAVVFFIRSFPKIFTQLEESSFVQERLLSDTVTGRVMFYNIALENLSRHLLIGIGSPKSEIYYHGVIRAGGREDEATGEVSGIHNLYLVLAFFHGLPVFLSFSIYLILLLVFYGILIWKRSKIFLLPFLIVLIYFLANFSNGFPLPTEIGMLMGIFTAFGAAMYHQKKNLFNSNFDNSKIR